MMKILSSFPLPILLIGKRKKNKDAFGKKSFYKALFLIFLLHNSFEDAFMLFPLYLPIVSSNFCFFPAKLGIGIFSKNNATKNKGEDLESTNADRKTRMNDPGTR